MNEKRTALLTVCLLGAFLLTFSLWAYLKPDDAFSQSERRKLTPKPSCTVESICSGRYMSDFETYAPDQFPLREQFRTLKSLTSLYLLRQRDQRRISGGGLCLPSGVPPAGGLHRPRRPAL